MLATLRPGIYSDYENSNLMWSSDNGKTVGIVAVAGAEAGNVYTVSKIADAAAIFGDTEKMTTLCTLAIQNGAKRVLAVPVAEEAPDYGAAFAALEAEDVNILICDSEDITVHQLLKTSVLSASAAMHERIGIVACAAEEDRETWAGSFNCERIVLIAQNPVDEREEVQSGCFIAAAAAGLFCKDEDPTVIFNGSQLKGIAALSQTLSEEAVDQFISWGITPLEVVIDTAEIIRAVTSRVLTDGQKDTKFRDVNIILIQDAVISELRNSLKGNLLGAKNNSLTQNSIVTQAIIVLEKYRNSGAIESYQKPEVSFLASDPSVCVVSVAFVVSRGFNQVHICATLKV